jgi:nitroreductase
MERDTPYLPALRRPAANDHPIHPLIAERFSAIAFAKRAVAPEAVRTVLEAARWAASSFNEQPWAFFVALREDSASYQPLLNCLIDSNRTWAQRAPVLLLSVARLRFAANGKANPHAWHDVGAASASMALQATALGLALHPMAGFFRERAVEQLAIPSDCEPVAAFALGYPDDPSALPEKLAQRAQAARTRKPLDQFVYRGRWAEPAPLTDGSR